MTILRIKALLSQNPNSYQLNFQLATLLIEKNRIEEAQSYLNKALLINPQSLEANIELAHSFRLINQVSKAIDIYAGLLITHPNRADLLADLGNLHMEIQAYESAKFYFEKALSINPEDPITLYSIGNLCQREGNYAEAIKYMLSALQFKPEFAESHFQLAHLFKSLGKHSPALYHCIEALLYRPDAAAFDLLGQEILNIKHFPEGIEHIYQKLSQRPNRKQFASQLRDFSLKLNKYQTSLHFFFEALKLNPDSAKTLANIAYLYMEIGQQKNAQKYLELALELKPDKSIYSAYILFNIAKFETTQKQFFEITCQWDKVYGSTIKPITHHVNTTPTRPEKKLKIGYVSSELRQTSALPVFKALFQHHNSSEYEIFVYSDTVNCDEKTEELKQWSSKWLNIKGWSDQQLVDVIQEDCIDILVNLGHHIANSRLQAFTASPAPIQVTGPGFSRTTGLKSMSYQFSDLFMTPISSSRYNSEKVFYLKTLLLWKPPEFELPEVPASSHKNTEIIFGAAFYLHKMNPHLINYWSQILKQCPQSTLHFKSPSFDDPYVQSYFRNEFLKHGIKERVVFFGETSLKEHLQFFQHIDIALDPFPYHGGIGFCEILWAGVPIISLNMGTSRAGPAILKLCQLDELIAETPDDYIKKAVELAQDQTTLQTYKQTLKDKILNSPLCDSKNYTLQIEQAYRTMWRTWCRKQKN